jgi:hypothetical protein
MKYILFILLFFSMQKSFAQDSASQNITVLLPVKALVLQGAFMSENPNWSERKTPDLLASLIGSGTQPDSLVTVTMKAGMLLNFIRRLSGERYGMIGTTARSILNNVPSITGYTNLLSQINAKANSGGQQVAANYIKNGYQAYADILAALYSEYYQRGVDWIKN